MKNDARALARVLLASALVLPGTLALAQGKADPQKIAQALEQRFNAADKNQDGLLTQAEADAGMPRLAKAFDRIDTEKKGTLSLEQIKVFMAKNAPKRAAGNP